jgi:hypothetical protein
MQRHALAFSFSVGERKIMNHFVVQRLFRFWLPLCRALGLCGECVFIVNPEEPAMRSIPAFH